MGGVLIRKDGTATPTGFEQGLSPSSGAASAAPAAAPCCGRAGCEGLVLRPALALHLPAGQALAAAREVADRTDGNGGCNVPMGRIFKRQVIDKPPEAEYNSSKHLSRRRMPRRLRRSARLGANRLDSTTLFGPS